MSTRKTFVSGILVLTSPINGVNTFALAPEQVPAQPQCHGKPTSWISFPSMVNGLNRFVTHALRVILPRIEVTSTLSPLLITFIAASSSLISRKGSGISSHCVGQFLVNPPPCQCSVSL